MLADIPDYNTRISAGKVVEKSILDGLRKRGIKIDNPSESEDKYEKIDGWWIDSKQRRHPLQVKFRQSGDDILFELTKDIDKKIVGRDLKSKATLYLVANRSGTTRLFFTKPIKEKAEQLLKTVEDDLKKEPHKTQWSGNGWEVKLQIDRAHGQRKLVAYFKPNLFDAIASWNLNIHEAVFKSLLKRFIINELKKIDFHIPK